MTRLEANQAILLLLSEYIVNHPEERFCQVLRNLGVVNTVLDDISYCVFFSDEFNTESVDTLDNIKQQLRKIGTKNR